MAETWIYIEHPDLKDSLIVVTLTSFVKLYEGKGWVAVEDPKVLEVETPREAKARVFKQIKKRKTSAKK